MKQWKFQRNTTTKKYIGLYVETGYRQTVLWAVCISGILTVGALFSFAVLWGSFAPRMVFPALVAAVELLCCCGANALRKKSPAGILVALVPWIIFPAVMGFGNCVNGFFTWLNVLISDWNQIHEAGVVLFQADASSTTVLAFSVGMALIVATLIWLLVVKRHLFLCSLFCLFWIFLQLLTEQLHPVSASLLLTGLVAFYFSGSELRITRRGLWWCVGIAAFLMISAVRLPEDTITSIVEAGKEVQLWIHDARYGVQILPEGDLYKTDKLQESTEEMLTVKTVQEKNLYLRAFVGGVYEDGCWKELPDAAFGGDNTGMLEWLKKQQFDPLTQTASYYALDEENEAMASNLVQVSVTGASRDRIYALSSLSTYPGRLAKADHDAGLTSRRFRGEQSYRLEETSSVRPSELMVASPWVSEPETEEQQRYSEAEAVYRTFVHDQYTDTDPALYETIQDMFWSDYESDTDGIYSALTQIRQVLRDRVNYTEEPVEIPEGADPILYFLIRSRAGNSMLYASTAVEAFRIHGIPARYAEGYYVSTDMENQAGDGAVSVTGKNAHAWVEVYFDGMGWMPVDVTPGYYYDTVALQQMVGLPDTAHRTAAFENDGTEASAISNADGTLAGSLADAMHKAFDRVKAALGVLAVLLLILTIVLAALELWRIFLTGQLHHIYDQASATGKVHLLAGTLFYFLSVAGISARLGWNTGEADAKITAQFPGIAKGEYSHCCALIEKNIYGEIELEPFELRTLNCFMDKLLDGIRGRDWKSALRIHCAVFYKTYRRAVLGGVRGLYHSMTPEKKQLHLQD